MSTKREFRGNFHWENKIEGGGGRGPEYQFEGRSTKRGGQEGFEQMWGEGNGGTEGGLCEKKKLWRVAVKPTQVKNPEKHKKPRLEKYPYPEEYVTPKIEESRKLESGRGAFMNATKQGEVSGGEKKKKSVKDERKAEQGSENDGGKRGGSRLRGERNLGTWGDLFYRGKKKKRGIKLARGFEPCGLSHNGRGGSLINEERKHRGF